MDSPLSAHAQVGLLLTRVFHEFSSAEKERGTVGASATAAVAHSAAVALRLAFELLKSGSYLTHETEKPDDAGSAGQKEGTRDCEPREARRRRREAFLESSFLPFATFLLREVGPTWLPIWDRYSTTAEFTANAPIPAKGAAMSHEALLLPAGAGDPVADVGGAVDIHLPGQQQRNRVATGSESGSVVRKAEKGEEVDMEEQEAYVPLRARDVFEAFFRPPLVPASLALTVLFDGLGRRPGGEPIVSYGAMVPYVGGARNDARTVQLACRLLEPYLEPLLVPPQKLRRSHGDGNNISSADYGILLLNGHAETAANFSSAAILTSSNARVAASEEATGGGSGSHKTLGVETVIHKNDGNDCSSMLLSNRRPLFVQAVKELALGYRSDSDRTTPTSGRGTNNEVGVSRRSGDGGGGGIVVGGGDAAEGFASALCLAPQRVANALGPLAPPAFSPGSLFPAVCRAVVRATLLCCTLLPPARASQAVGGTSISGARDAETYGKEEEKEDATDAVAAATAGRLGGVEAGFDAKGMEGDTGRRRQPHAQARMITAMREMWRALSGKLLIAGRASDLADAWLQAIVDKATTDMTTEEGGLLSCSDWGAWADGPEAEIHAWMINSIPASVRKAFTEALLQALWPPRSRPRRYDGHAWPPGFGTAICRGLIGRTLVDPMPKGESRGAGGQETDGAREQGHVDLGLDLGAQADLGVSLVEDLLLHRPLPHPAADAIADTLAWCDRRVTAAGGGEEEGSEDRKKSARLLVMGSLQRVAAVWAEPSFVNSSPPRQQDFYTRFLLAALRSGAVDSASLMSGGGDALALLVRGVSTHLDVPTRATRLQGMRVGEALALVTGQDLRFEELDGERERAVKNVGNCEGELDKSGAKSTDDGEQQESATETSGGVDNGRIENRRKQKKEGLPRKNERRGKPMPDHGRNTKKITGTLAGSYYERADLKGADAGGENGEGHVGNELEGGLDVDPDMLLPLTGDRGDGGGSDSDDDSDVEGFVTSTTTKTAGDEDSSAGGGDGDSDSSSCSSDNDSSVTSGYGENDADDLGDGFDAYDLWDDQEDLAKVAEPVYLDQLIEMLRSRDQPETADQHEIALAHAEALVRRNPPDLAHRATELARDLLYLENPFDLEGFEPLRVRAMVATTAAAPETCALYLGSEVWGTGASEGTKLLILDILVKAASELAGWISPTNGVGGTSGAYPSALMQEARGTVQGSVRRLQSSAGGAAKPSARGMLKASTKTATTPATTAATAKAATTSSSSRAAVAPEVVSAAKHAKTEDTEGRDASALATTEDGKPLATGNPKNGGAVSAVGGGGGGGGGRTAVGRTRRWGYRRGPREQSRRNMFGKFAPVFFYPLAQGMVLRLRETAAAKTPTESSTDRYVLLGGPPPPPPSALLSARLLHALTCMVELSGSCPATPALAADLLGLAWLLRVSALRSRELQKAVLIAIATGIERSQDGAGLAFLQAEAGEFLRFLQACMTGADTDTKELAGFVLGHSSVRALAYF